MSKLKFKLTTEQIGNEFDELINKLYRKEGVKLFSTDEKLNDEKTSYIYKTI
jgi:hypothetical protein